MLISGSVELVRKNNFLSRALWALWHLAALDSCSIARKEDGSICWSWAVSTDLPSLLSRVGKAADPQNNDWMFVPQVFSISSQIPVTLSFFADEFHLSECLCAMNSSTWIVKTLWEDSPSVPNNKKLQQFIRVGSYNKQSIPKTFKQNMTSQRW